MGEVRFPLGTGPFATVLVMLGLFAASGYFGNAGITDLGEPIAIGGREIADREAVRLGFYVVSGLFGLAGLYLLLRTLRNFGREQAVVLDANRIVVTGLDFEGGDKVLSFAEIASFAEFRSRGIPVIELTGRDGSKIALGSIQFRSASEFAEFRRELAARLPHLATLLH